MESLKDYLKEVNEARCTYPDEVGVDGFYEAVVERQLREVLNETGAYEPVLVLKAALEEGRIIGYISDMVEGSNGRAGCIFSVLEDAIISVFGEYTGKDNLISAMRRCANLATPSKFVNAIDYNGLLVWEGEWTESLTYLEKFVFSVRRGETCETNNRLSFVYGIVCEWLRENFPPRDN